jgi:phenylacetic acid degradation operon negative regulatory protein
VVASFSEEEGAQLRGLQPRALIVTIYGLYAREAGGWLSVGALIRLMAELGVDEPAVRSSISRLKQRGILLAEKSQGVAGYSLSDDAREILREGDRRIFERKRAQADDGWLIAVFSVPESEREKRHQIRSRLSWLGFGTVSSGVWIAPMQVEPQVRDVLDRGGLGEYVDLFRADHVGAGPLKDKVASWWDLEALEVMYEEFISVYGPVLATWRRRRRANAPTAFADYVKVLTHWRRLPYLDPGLAPELLPAVWRGSRAADLFFELKERLAPDAHRHVEAVVNS